MREPRAPQRSAWDAAIEALARRAHAENELRRALVRRRYDAVDVDTAIERLRSHGLLDDAAFAVTFARSRAENRAMGARRIATELARRGVDRHVAAAAIAEVFARESLDEQQLLERAAERKLGTLTALPGDVRRRRLLAFLIRRGFGPTQAAAATRRLVPH